MTRAALEPLPGLILAALLASLALWLAGLPFVQHTLHVSALLLVILLGMLWKSLAPVPESALPGIRMAQRPVLRWAVAGLGFRLSLPELVKIGAPALGVVVISTIAALWFGWWISRRLGLSPGLGRLLGCGSRDEMADVAHERSTPMNGRLFRCGAERAIAV